jgi:hypothetical protein
MGQEVREQSNSVRESPAQAMPDAPKFKTFALRVRSLRKSLNAPLPNQDSKRKDQEDDDERDKSGAKISKTQRTSSTSSSAETAASPQRVRRS